VIARPFRGGEGTFRRTEGRRDFTLRPPGRSHLQELRDAGVDVHAVGKISDLFAGAGISGTHPGATNAEAMDSVVRLACSDEGGLVFANLIETDQTYGHRKDVHGFHGALRELDGRIGALLDGMRDEDLLIVTADHGVDPAQPGTDHTREYAPLLAVTRGMARCGELGARHDGPLADVGATVLGWLTGRRADALPGEPFL
jgi:phosphopentomutase